MHKIIYSPVVGSPVESAWAGSFSNDSLNLYCSLAVKGANAKNQGLELAQLIKLHQDVSASAIHNLILDLIKKARDRALVLQLSLVSFPSIQAENKQVVVLASYQGLVLLKRNSKLATLLSSSNEVQLIEGSPKPNDHYLLATANTEQLEQSIRQQFISEISVDAMASNLKQKVKMLIDSSLFATTFLRVGQLDFSCSSPSFKNSFQSASPLSASLNQATIQPNQTPFPGDNDQQTKTGISTQQTPSSSNLSKDINTPSEKTIQTYLGKNPILDQPKQIIKPERKTEEIFQEIQKNFVGSNFPELERNTHNHTISPSLLNDLAKNNTKPDLQKLENNDVVVRIDSVSIKEQIKRFNQAISSTAMKTFLKIKNLVLLIRQLPHTLKKKLKLDQTKNRLLSQQEERKTELETSIELIPNINSSSGITKIGQTKKTRLSFQQLLDSVLHFKSSFSKKDVFLYRNNNKKLKILLLIVFLSIVTSISGLALIQVVNNDRNQAKQSLSSAEELLAQADEIVESDIIRARDFTDQAIQEAIVAQKQNQDLRFSNSIFSEFILMAQEKFKQIDGQLELAQLEIFFDLRTISPAFISTASTNNSQFLFFVDQEQKEMILLDLNSKNTIQLSLSDLGSIESLSASEKNLFILNSGIYRLDLSTIQSRLDLESAETNQIIGPITKIKDEGDSDREATLLGSFENFLYVFNPVRRNIYRYIVRGTELSEPIGWLINRQGLEFNNVSNLAIDGQIWLATENGNVVRLERGEPVEFSISGLSQPINNSIIVSTNAQAKYLYLLEPNQNRLLVMSKNGEFAKQITSPTFASTNQLLINEQAGLAFVVSGSIVYQIKI